MEEGKGRIKEERERGEKKSKNIKDIDVQYMHIDKIGKREEGRERQKETKRKVEREGAHSLLHY